MSGEGLHDHWSSGFNNFAVSRKLTIFSSTLEQNPFIFSLFCDPFTLFFLCFS